ncbi:hypothetical protein C7271_22265 [filamentous cyanobacterium CCP5]|nr:hypothetical protein C7271_22265 [filamentous cyanobacterium CCP5]
MREQINRLISWILVLDFALVLASLAWFLLAVAGRSFKVDLGLELWYQLWNPLFLPAISLLMAGAIASGVMGWVGRKLDQFKPEP